MIRTQWHRGQSGWEHCADNLRTAVMCLPLSAPESLVKIKNIMITKWGKKEIISNSHHSTGAPVKDPTRSGVTSSWPKLAFMNLDPIQPEGNLNVCNIFNLKYVMFNIIIEYFLSKILLFYKNWKCYNDWNYHNVYLPQCSHWGCCKELSYWSQQNKVLFYRRSTIHTMVKSLIYDICDLPAVPAVKVPASTSKLFKYSPFVWSVISRS